MEYAQAGLTGSGPPGREVSRPRLDLDSRPILVFWEVTRACLLACRHCRASAIPEPLPGELSTGASGAIGEIERAYRRRLRAERLEALRLGRNLPPASGIVVMSPIAKTPSTFVASVARSIGMKPVSAARLLSRAGAGGRCGGTPSNVLRAQLGAPLPHRRDLLERLRAGEVQPLVEQLVGRQVSRFGFRRVWRCIASPGAGAGEGRPCCVLPKPTICANRSATFGSTGLFAMSPVLQSVEFEVLLPATIEGSSSHVAL